MDPKQISSLAKLLRDSGDKVLNCNFKLTLSGKRDCYSQTTPLYA